MAMKSEKGISLIETIVALALLGTIGAALLAGTATTSSARATADERVSAKILAESIMEEIKKLPYDTSSNYTYTVPEEFAAYTVNLTVENLMNNNIQKVPVGVERRDHVVLSLESYKSSR